MFIHERHRQRLSVAWLAVPMLVLTACGITEPDGGTPDVAGVTVTAQTTSVGIGATLQLTSTVTPAGTPQTVTWTSSDEGRLSVDENGLATAAVARLTAGTVRVTATSTADPSFSGFADITITCGALLPAAVVDGGTVASETCYVVESPLTVSGGTLFVDPGARIEFGPSGSLTITGAGRLSAIGTADLPVTFTSSDPAGTWRGIRFNDSRGGDNRLEYVEIENGGSDGWSGATQSAAALLLEGNTLVDIAASTIVGSVSQGMSVYADVEFTLTGSTLSDNAIPIWAHPNTVHGLASDLVFDGNDQQVVQVGFGNNDAVTTAQTWQSVGVPFEIQERMFVRAPLTLQPGVTLESREGVSIIVDDEGTLTAVGTAEAPITFGGAESSPGSWKGLQILTQSNNNVFDHVVFEYGGGEAWTGGVDSRSMVFLAGSSKALFRASTFRHSAHYALWVPSGGDITGFEDNHFTLNARTMIVHPNRVGAIASSNSFLDNDEWVVRVTFGNNDAVVASQTWSALDGTPYRIMERTFVRAALTIEAGATLEFAQDVSLVVADEGSLNAIGTAEDPIYFFGSERGLAGYWKGIQVGTVTAANAFANVRFSDAGSQAWFGGAGSVATVWVTADGILDLEDVTFTQSGGYAAIVSFGGGLSCSGVDDGGYQYYVYSPAGAAQPTCPS